MRLLSIIASFSLLAIFGFSTKEKTSSNTDGWKFIADKTVSFGVDRDVIHFGNRKDEFRQLKLRVTDGPIKIYDMKVHFDNGGVQDVNLRSIILQGAESRVIDLDGGIRSLSKIEFTYETRGYKRGRARVAVWGKN